MNVCRCGRYIDYEPGRRKQPVYCNVCRAKIASAKRKGYKKQAKGGESVKRKPNYFAECRKCGSKFPVENRVEETMKKLCPDCRKKRFEKKAKDAGKTYTYTCQMCQKTFETLSKGTAARRKYCDDCGRERNREQQTERYALMKARRDARRGNAAYCKECSAVTKPWEKSKPPTAPKEKRFTFDEVAAQAKKRGISYGYMRVILDGAGRLDEKKTADAATSAAK